MRFKFLIFICAALMSANAVYSAVVDTIPEIVWEKKMLSIRGIYVGPNDEYVMTVGSNANYLIFHNPENGEPTDTLTIDDGINDLTASNDGTILAINNNDHSKESISLYDGASKKILKKLTDDIDFHTGPLAISYDKKLLAVASKYCGVVVWDIESNKIIKRVGYPYRSGDTVSHIISSVKFTPDNKYLIAEGVWRDSVTTATGYVLPTHPIKKVFSVENNFDSIDTDVLSGVYSKTGKYCLTFNRFLSKPRLCIYNYATRQLIDSSLFYGITTNGNLQVDFTQDDRYMIIVNGEKDFIYDLELGSLVATYINSGLSNNQFSRDGNYFFGNIAYYLFKVKSPWTKTGIEETEVSSELIYPNPANNTFTIDLVLSVSGNYKMQIADASGKTVQTCDLGYLDSGKQSITGNLKEIASGCYIVSVVGDNQIKSFKVVVK